MTIGAKLASHLSQYLLHLIFTLLIQYHPLFRIFTNPFTTFIDLYEDRKVSHDTTKSSLIEKASYLNASKESQSKTGLSISTRVSFTHLYKFYSIAGIRIAHYFPHKLFSLAPLAFLNN